MNDPTRPGGLDTQGYYDAFSERYDDGRGAGYHALVDDLEARAVAPWVPGADVLEVGCGTGLVAARLRDLGARRVVGVDLSPGMLRRFLGRGLGGVVGDATALPFPDGCFDLVCSFKVMAHVPDLEGAIREARRVTRPGGVVAIELYNRRSLRFLARRVAGPRKTSAVADEGDVFTRWDSPAGIRSAMERAELDWIGFRGVRVATPWARALELPVVGGALTLLERRLFDSPLAVFGGFLVALARRPTASAPC